MCICMHELSALKQMIKEYLGWQLQQWISSYATDTQWLFEYEILFIKEKHIELF